MGENKRNRCKICNSTNVAQINKAIRRGDSVTKISKLYGYDRRTLSKHKKECVPALIDVAVQKEIISDNLIDDIRAQLDLVRKLVRACDEWLTDPEDPEKYFLGPRGEEIEISYQDVDDDGRALPGRRKATLQELVQEIRSSGNYSLLNITNRHADPRDLLLKAISKLEGTVKMIEEATRQQIKWEHEKVELEHKRAALEKVSKEGGTIELEKQIATITEKVTIALKSSDSEELCREAGLPEL